MGLRSVRFVVLPLLLLLMAGTTLAASATLTVDTVGGKRVIDGSVNKPLSGKALVTGTFSPSTAESDAPEPTALVADAGNSGFATSGEAITLMGAGYGGSEPYSFAWSSPIGEIEGSDAPTSLLHTDDVAEGTYDVSLTVTDASGASASDTVKVVIVSGAPTTILDETRNDPAPGTLVTGETIEFPFTVPAGTTRIDVFAEWGLIANDYDMRVIDPAGVERASSGNAAGEPETAAVPTPQAGDWIVVLDKYLTLADTVHVVVTAVGSAADPRPIVDAGGPYRFEPGQTQTLTGTVTGGAAPVSAGWDTDMDGLIDMDGASITTSFAQGRHMVTFKATDANGLERRQMVSVLVATADRLAEETTAVTVIGIADSGINPYHLEFSAETYPDPDVLALTDNFRKHPSEYIPGFPASAEALNITLGRGYFPEADTDIWTADRIQAGNVYWIPGTKIISAIDTSVSTGVTSGDDIYPILDDNGHGSGSASVSAGNRYGYCPTCLLAVVEGLDESINTTFSWIDITSHSFGYVGGLPIGPVLGPNDATRAAAERGQTVLFAAGNGIGNAFDVPIATYGSDQTGPDWNITVGAIRRDNERAIVGDGIPVHISAWGDGNLPSACRTGTVGQCAFGGTSAATPYTAGIFGTVLTEVKQHLGDGTPGQDAGQVVAQGISLANSQYLSDGKLTRTELRDAVLKNAYPLNTDNEPSIFPYTATAPYTGDENVLFEGYGAATPDGAERAIGVLLGDAPMPLRPFEDSFFALDRQIRDAIYGGYDRDGDGHVESYAPAQDLGLSASSLTTPEAVLTAMQKVAALTAPVVPNDQLLGSSALRYYLHREFVAEPGTVESCLEADNEKYMDTDDRSGDLELCFDSRITSVVAAYRPVGIWAAMTTIDTPIPAGSSVYVELYMAGETPTVVRPTGVLMAGDREIGTGQANPAPVLGSGPGGAACTTMGELCWSKFVIAFETTRPAIHGEQLTFQVQLIGARSWAFGYEGAHASRVTIVPSAIPADGSLDFGTTITDPADGASIQEGNVTALGSVSFPGMGAEDESGSQPDERRVEVSINDPSFGDPIEADLNQDAGWWSAPLGSLAPGEYTIYSRARIDTTVSDVASRSFTVTPSPVAVTIQYQVVPHGGQTVAENWGTAYVAEFRYQFEIATSAYSAGDYDIVVRLLENGSEQASQRVKVTFKGK